MLFASEPVLADENDAQIALNSAQLTLLNCFAAAKNAEAAGANITLLMTTLNSANSLLSKAQAAYSENDYSTAYTLATQSQNQLANFVSDANSAQNNALIVENSNLLVAELSIVFAIAVLAVGCASWFYLGQKRKLEAHA